MKGLGLSCYDTYCTMPTEILTLKAAHPSLGKSWLPAEQKWQDFGGQSRSLSYTQKLCHIFLGLFSRWFGLFSQWKIHHDWGIDEVNIWIFFGDPFFRKSKNFFSSGREPAEEVHYRIRDLFTLVASWRYVVSQFAIPPFSRSSPLAYKTIQLHMYTHIYIYTIDIHYKFNVYLVVFNLQLFHNR
jgi:hypothetical protein